MGLSRQPNSYLFLETWPLVEQGPEQIHSQWGLYFALTFCYQ